MVPWGLLPYVIDEVTEGVNELKETKQDKLTAGTNITIDSNNVISATGGGTDVTIVDEGEYIKLTVDTDESELVKASTYIADVTDIEEAITALQVIGSEYSKSFDSKTFANGTATNVGSVTLNKGRYLMIGTLYYASNATGRRVVKLSTTANDVSASRRAYDAINPVSGTQTCAKVTTIMNISADNTSVYLNGAQNSGSSLSANGLIEIVRLQ